MQRIGPLILLGAVAITALGCPTVDLGENPPAPPQCNPDPIYYRDVIWPQFIAPSDPNLSCVNEAGCHRLEDGRSALRLEIPANAADPGDPAHAENYSVVTRFLNCGVPDASPMLTAPMATVDSHGGGDLFSEDNSPGSQRFLFEEWFRQ